MVAVGCSEYAITNLMTFLDGSDAIMVVSFKFIKWVDVCKVVEYDLCSLPK